MTGDFNEEPQNPAIKDVMKGSFDSAFEMALCQGKEPPFTTFKYRESTGYQKRTIDYVFYNGSITTTGYLKMPEESQIDQDMANPCKDHPSDHYALAFTFDLRRHPFIM